METSGLLGVRTGSFPGSPPSDSHLLGQTGGCWDCCFGKGPRAHALGDEDGKVLGFRSGVSPVCWVRLSSANEGMKCRWVETEESDGFLCGCRGVCVCVCVRERACVQVCVCMCTLNLLRCGNSSESCYLCFLQGKVAKAVDVLLQVPDAL